MESNLYPLQFTPILKDKIWGGTKLKTILNKDITSDTTGESWEISTVGEDVSIISNGEFAGKSLNEIIAIYPDEILGAAVYKKFGKQFPLLFKFIDATQDLSIQVHPNDELAKKRHNSFGKTEMWYIMQADASARLIVGFKENSSAEEYIQHLNDKKLVSILDEIPAHEGDVYFLATGTIHAIGAGIVLAEIQQTSDITYRVFDWDRVDAEGNSRELHTELALEAINYHQLDTQKKYDAIVNHSNTVVDCPYFTTNFLPLNGRLDVDKDGSSFTVYMCVDGNFDLKYEDISYAYQKGDTVLIPGAMYSYELSGSASLLEIYIS